MFVRIFNYLKKKGQVYLIISLFYLIILFHNFNLYKVLNSIATILFNTKLVQSKESYEIKREYLVTMKIVKT